MNDLKLFEEANTLYDQGNLESAFQLFLKAAELGDSSSMNRLACMYADGEGISRDIDKSIYWDQKAAELGNTSSLLNLAITYRTVGDMVSAKSWFERAIEFGDGEAALQLAKMYMVSTKEQSTINQLLSLSLKLGSLCEESEEEVESLIKGKE